MWEYEVRPLPIKNFDYLQNGLSDIGREGWELVNIIESPALKKVFDTDTICFAILKKLKS